MSRTGLSTLQPVLSKAQICGVKRFPAVSVPIPVTHTQSPPMTGWFQCRWRWSCCSNAPGEASYLRLGRAGRGRKFRAVAGGALQNGYLSLTWATRGMLWDLCHGGCGAGYAVREKSGQPPSHFLLELLSHTRGTARRRPVSWALGLTAPQGSDRESWALAAASAPEVGAQHSGA